MVLPSPEKIFKNKPVEEGGDRPVIENSETAAVLESLEGLFPGLTWWA